MSSARAMFFCGLVVTIAAIGLLITIAVAVHITETNEWNRAPFTPGQLVAIGVVGLIAGGCAMGLAWLSPRE